MTSPSFDGDRILGAILFEDTMDRRIEGRDSADYLWTEKQVVPFVKVDKGLTDEADGVQVMQPIPDLDALLARAIDKGCSARRCGRSSSSPTPAGSGDGRPAVRHRPARSSATGLVPIIEPEVDIHSPEKADAEALLRRAIVEQLGRLAPDQLVMLKLTLPEADDFYADLVDHPQRAPGGRALRRLQPRRGQRPPRPQPRRDRQLLAGPDRGPVGPAERRGVRRHAGRLDRRASSRRRSPDRWRSPGAGP